MKVITVSKQLVDPIPLPGMGRSVEATGLTTGDVQEIQTAFAEHELYIEYAEEPGSRVRVNQIWINPHAPQVTFFI